VRDAVKDPSALHHVGIAHGSLEGISPDFNGDYYPMTGAQLEESGLHLWLLGHTHVRFPARPSGTDRIFNAGTPAPDGFDCTHAGGAWALELSDERTVAAQAVLTGSLRFVEETFAVRAAADMEKIAARFAGPDAKSILLRAHLEGRAPREVIALIGGLRQRMADSLLHLDLRTDGLREEITRQTVDREFPEGSFPHSLLSELVEAGDPDALEIAHELITETQR
jgi:exonuclease SbcD